MIELEVPLLKKRFMTVTNADYPDQEAYANLPADTIGQYQPVVLGAVSAFSGTLLNKWTQSVPVMMVDPGTDQGAGVWRARKFKICATIKNPNTGTVHGISAPTLIRMSANVASALVVTTNYTLSENNTLITMNNAASGDLLANDEIRANNFWLLDDASGTFSGTASGAISQVPYLIDFLITCLSPVPIARMNKASMTWIGMTTKPGVSNGTFPLPGWAGGGTGPVQFAYLSDQINVIDIIDTMAFSMDGILQLSMAGIYILMPILLPASTDAFVTDGDITGWEETLSLDSIINRISVQYAQVAAGAQNAFQGRIATHHLNKRGKPSRRYKLSAIIDVAATEAFAVVQATMTRSIGGVSVLDDLGSVLGVEHELTVTTYFAYGEVTIAQYFANELYRRWNRGIWDAQFTDVNGALIAKFPGENFYVHRKRSSHGSLALGKSYRVIDAIRNYFNKTIEIFRADEVI